MPVASKLSGRSGFSQHKNSPEDASHVRNAITCINQVQGVTDEKRDEAWVRIHAAARTFDVEMNEGDWRDR